MTFLMDNNRIYESWVKICQRLNELWNEAIRLYRNEVKLLEMEKEKKGKETKKNNLSSTKKKPKESPS